jgi:hypothetical protein
LRGGTGEEKGRNNEGGRGKREDKDRLRTKYGTEMIKIAKFKNNLPRKKKPRPRALTEAPV